MIYSLKIKIEEEINIFVFSSYLKLLISSIFKKMKNFQILLYYSKEFKIHIQHLLNILFFIKFGFRNFLPKFYNKGEECVLQLFG